jgi:hypothetical protein
MNHPLALFDGPSYFWPKHYDLATDSSAKSAKSLISILFRRKVLNQYFGIRLLPIIHHHHQTPTMSEIISPPLGAPGLRLTQTQKDLVGGSIGGIAQVLVGQPFDIVKVRIQTSPSGTFASPLDCAKQLLKADGPRGFYKVSHIDLPRS